ncbi:MFS transporter [Streptomyces sp. JJ66]|uniref:MFS transporter n=1 Tax=Streptomyces sp. JJ66 TaxID=2803843 RepID=UPI0035AFF41E
MTNPAEGADTPAISALAPAVSPVAPPAAGVPSAPEVAAIRRRTNAVLIASQVLGGLGVATAIALAAVLAQDIGGSEAVAGLASTASVIGTALLSVPLAALMAARGRRAGLTLAYLIAAAGGAVVVVAAVLGWFPLLLAGMAAFGAGSSANLQARFAAADLAEPQHRARTISLVVWATTIGAVTGPNLAGPAGRSLAGFGIPQTAGPFVWGTGIFLIAGALVWFLLRPDPLLTARAIAAGAGDGPDDSGADRSVRAGWRAVTASPRALLALAAITGSHTVMVAVMVMTPVDLSHHGADLELIGFVISGHIAGMYAFSPVMGWLADRVGRVAVIGFGMGLLALATLLAGTSGGDHTQSAVGLFLLGLGWSAGLVAGSALLTDSVPGAARTAAQGLSDLASNAAAGAGGALSGVVVAQAGYGWLNALAATLLLPLAVLALRAARHRG